MESINWTRKIILAIERYKSDITNYPIYFKQAELKYIESQVAIDNIQKKLEDKEYLPEIAGTYSIPYDTISTRVCYAPNIDDLIIRYVLQNYFEENVDFYSNKINYSQFNVYAIVDIFDCYNQIDKDILIETIKNELTNKVEDKYLFLLEKCLNNGILIGSKPDEYFAELFLSLIHSKINLKVSENIERNGDEFLIFGNTIRLLYV